MVVKIVLTGGRESTTVQWLLTQQPHKHNAADCLWNTLGLVPLLCKPLAFDRRRELTALVMPLLVPLAALHEATHDIRVPLVVVSQMVRVSSRARGWSWLAVNMVGRFRYC